MASQTLTISPSSAKSWIFGGIERASLSSAQPKPAATQVKEDDSFPPFDELSPKAKAQVLVEVAGQLRAGVPAVSHQMSVIHQRRLNAVEKDLDAWLERISITLGPVAERGDAAVPKVSASIRSERLEGMKIIDQLQWNIPAWGLTRGLQTFLRGCESL
ncbi:MAG: hypothetical protein ACI8XO_002892 [Verrucomicrobiales bacterium]|jgi:hypothetical protein